MVSTVDDNAGSSVGATVTAVEPGTLTIQSISADKSTADAGDEIVYTVTVKYPSNTPNAAAYDLAVTATVLNTIEVQSGDGVNQINAGKTEITWNIAKFLQSQDTLTFKFVAMVKNTMRPLAAGVKCTGALSYDSYPLTIEGQGGRVYNAPSAESGLLELPRESFAFARHASSLTDTATSDVAIGELVQFKGVVTLPELTMALKVVASVNAGFKVINSSVALGGQITTSGLQEGQPGVDTTSSNNFVTFDFGTAVNAYDVVSDGPGDKITIDLWVQVKDSVSTDNADILGVSMVSSVGSNAGSAVDVSVTAVEPGTLAIESITADTSTADAGDNVEYTLTVKYPPGAPNADAYDLALTASVLDTMEVQSGDGSNQINGGKTAITWNIAKFAQTQSTLTFKFVAMVKNTMHPLASGVKCTGALTYDSYPLTIQGQGGRVYNAVQTVSSNLVLPREVLAFTRHATSLVDTATSSVAIGELVQLRGVVTLPELSMALNVVATIDAGFKVINSSVALGGQISTTELQEGESGADTTSSNNLVTFDFGTAVNAYDLVSAGPEDKITIDIWVQVKDVSSTQNAGALTVSMVSSVDSNAGGSIDVSVTAVEPGTLAIQSIVGDKSTGDAGDMVEYTVTVKYPGSIPNADAYDLALSVSVVDTMEVQSASGSSDINAGKTAIAWNIGTFTQSQGTLTVTFVAMIKNTMHPLAAAVKCTGTLSYDSYPLTIQGEAGRTYNAVSLDSESLSLPRETLVFVRHSTSLVDTGAANVAISEVVQLRGIVTLPELTMALKVVATIDTGFKVINSSVSLGGQITTSGLQEGQAGVDSTSSNNLVAFDFGTTVNAYDVVADGAADKITIDLWVQVKDVPATTDADTLSVAMVSSVDTSAGSSIGVSVTAVEPGTLAIESIIADKTTADAGDEVEYTITVRYPSSTPNADAYDLALTATVLTTMAVKSGDGSNQINGGKTAITFTVAKFAQSEGTLTFKFVAMVKNTMRPLASGVKCTGALAYDSYPLTIEGQAGRAYTATPADSANLSLPRETTTFARFSTSLVDTAAAKVAIGELVQLRGIVTLPELTMALKVVATIDSGFKVINSSISLGSQITTSGLQGGQPGVDTTSTNNFVTFDFGTALNAYDAVSDGPSDKITIDMWVQVKDVAGTDDTDTLTASLVSSVGSNST